MWAWGASRVRRLTSVTRLAVILPFEEAFFRERGVAATFVGHPLRDRPPPPSRDEARRLLGLEPGRPTLGLFPGSRAQEVGRLWPAFRAAAERVRATRPDLQVVVAGTPRGRYPAPGDIVIHTGDPLPVFAAADAGLCKSGTTTLEAALADLPMVVAYRLNPVSNFIATRVLRVPWVGLVNLIAGYEVAPEFLQRAARPGAPDRVRALAQPHPAPPLPSARRGDGAPDQPASRRRLPGGAVSALGLSGGARLVPAGRGRGSAGLGAMARAGRRGGAHPRWTAGAGGAGEARCDRGGAARERPHHRRRRARVVRVVGRVVGPLLHPQAVRPRRCEVQPALRRGSGEGRAASRHRGGRACAPPGHLRRMTHALSRHRVAHWLWERRGAAALARPAPLPLALLYRGVIIARAAGI